MPRVEVTNPSGFTWTICTRQEETILFAWFDEVLPWSFIEGRPGIDDFHVIWPRVNVWPMPAWKHGRQCDPDWLTDSRVLGRNMELRARNGAEGLAELARIRRDLESELAVIKAARGR